MNPHPLCAKNAGLQVERCELGCEEDACCANSERGSSPYHCASQTEKALGSIANLSAPCPGCGLDRS